ncbi:hypothetical protein ACHHYP_00330 [Achlya hypogyna]|uniref:Myb-like domain-containing protein n=1 Tax=Achlya hypogyna TaxID=1202772 RepID=A0A1V9ZUL8_ACHHY|nr:hypothetical protein ACHHYP_00330 [Achlya hypogyna]
MAHAALPSEVAGRASPAPGPSDSVAAHRRRFLGHWIPFQEALLVNLVALRAANDPISQADAPDATVEAPISRKRSRSKSKSPQRVSPKKRSPPQKVKRSAAPTRRYQSPVVSLNSAYLGLNVHNSKPKEHEPTNGTLTTPVADLLRLHVEKMAALEKGPSKKRQLQRLRDPPRTKGHWDVLLDEMRWMATDFAEERHWKRALAWRIARDAADAKSLEKRSQEQNKRKLARSVALQVASFWRAMERIAARYHNRSPTALELTTRAAPKDTTLSPRSDAPVDFVWASPLPEHEAVRILTAAIFADSKAAREHMKKPEVPVDLDVKLAPFQVAALRFMMHIHACGHNFILNDQLGTGKAFTVSLFLRVLELQAPSEHPHLVIVPDAEVHKWAHYLKVLQGPACIQIYGGTPLDKRRQEQAWDPDFRQYLEPHEQQDVYCVVCPHSCFLDDAAAFTRRTWQVVVVEDFAPAATPVLAVANVSRRIVVSEVGLEHWTPERAALYGEFLLGAGAPWTPALWEDALAEAASVQLMMKQAGLPYKDEVSCLQIALRAITLGRIRNDIEAQLGKVEEQTLSVTLSASQANAYHAAVATFVASTEKAAMEVWLRFFLRLRAICNGVSLDVDRLASLDRLILASCSSKLMALVELMQRLVTQEQRKVALYLQSDAMLPVVEHLMANVLGILTVRITGSAACQHKALAHFALKDAVKVAILSSRTRTIGTNRAVCVYGAQAVVVLDSDWDPMCDSKLRASWQLLATTVDVPVHRLYTEHTIEAAFLRVGAVLSEKLFGEMAPTECVASNQLKGVECPHWWSVSTADLSQTMAAVEGIEKYCGGSLDGDIYALEAPLAPGGELELEEHLLLSNNDELTPVEWYAVHLVQALKEKQPMHRSAKPPADDVKDDAVPRSFDAMVYTQRVETWKQAPTAALVYEPAADEATVVNAFRAQGLVPSYGAWRPPDYDPATTLVKEPLDDVPMWVAYRTKKPPTPVAPTAADKKADAKPLKVKKTKVPGKGVSPPVPAGSPGVKRKESSKKSTDYAGFPLPDTSSGFDDDGFWGDTNLDALDSVSWDDTSILGGIQVGLESSLPAAKKPKTSPPVASTLPRPRKPSTDVAREGWSFVEESLMKKLHEMYGANWNLIAQVLTRQSTVKRRSARQCHEKYQRLTSANATLKDKDAAKPVKMKPLTMSPAALTSRVGVHASGLLLKYPSTAFGGIPPPPVRKTSAVVLKPPAVVQEQDVTQFRTTMEAVLMSVKKKVPSPPIPIPLNMEPHKSHLEIVATPVLSPDEVIKKSKQLAALTFQVASTSFPEPTPGLTTAETAPPPVVPTVAPSVPPAPAPGVPDEPVRPPVPIRYI